MVVETVEAGSNAVYCQLMTTNMDSVGWSIMIPDK